MGRLEFRQSPWKSLGLVLLAAAMVGASYVTAVKAPDALRRGVGWFGVAFFALGLLPGIRGLTGRRLTVVLDETGIQDTRLRIGLIPWNQVRECRVESIRGTAFLCLHLKAPELFLHQLSPTQRALAKANHAMGFGHLAISFTGLTPSIKEAVAFLEQASHRGIAPRCQTAEGWKA